MLHQRSGRPDLGDIRIAGLLFTFLAGVGFKIVQNPVYLLGNHIQLLPEELLADGYHLRTAAAGQQLIRKLQHNLSNRQVLRQFLHRALLLALMLLDGKGLLCRLFFLCVLLSLCLVEQAKLVRHDIIPFFAGLSESGTLGVEQQFVHALQFALEFLVFGGQCLHRIPKRIQFFLRDRHSGFRHEFSPPLRFLLYHKDGEKSNVFKGFRHLFL